MPSFVTVAAALSDVHVKYCTYLSWVTGGAGCHLPDCCMEKQLYLFLYCCHSFFNRSRVLCFPNWLLDLLQRLCFTSQLPFSGISSTDVGGCGTCCAESQGGASPGSGKQARCLASLAESSTPCWKRETTGQFAAFPTQSIHLHLLRSPGSSPLFHVGLNQRVLAPR